MQNLVVVGLQWGDEGKGKLVDFLSDKFDIVARFQGGSNAGHTVIIGDVVHKFRIIPTGAIRGKKVVIGNGVVVDPTVLLKEIDALQTAGIDVDLLLSDRAHLITPYQIELDGLQETAKGKQKIGTTKRGIGPTYSDKVTRVGVRVVDFFDEHATIPWKRLEDYSRAKIEKIYSSSATDLKLSAYNEYIKLMQRLQSSVGDCGEYLSQEMESGKKVLFEGAQGSLLDIDHGTYPYVTSSNCVSAAASTGTGVSPQRITDVLGICKAYLTRVGTGPFPTELFDKTGELIQQKGGEVGTVTGRARRCGWLDLVALKYTVRLNGTQYLAVTKIDVLSCLETLKVCVGYEISGTEYDSVPASALAYEKAEPIYKEFDSWDDPPNGDWTEIISEGYDSLPVELKDYLREIETFTGTKVAIASVGPDRSETIINSRVAPWSS
ncbi:MAG: adenylosuccinate synthase [Candidatus Thorarchaeota archaeon]